MLEKFERYPLTFGPTPIEHLKRLSEHLGGVVAMLLDRLEEEPDRVWSEDDIKALQLDPSSVRRAFKRHLGIGASAGSSSTSGGMRLPRRN